MKELLRKALSKFTGTYADIRYEENRLERLAFNKRELQDISMQTTRGGHVRVLRQGGWGTNSFIEPADAPKAVKLASSAAGIAGKSSKRKVALAPVPAVQFTVYPNSPLDPRGVSFDEKKSLIEQYNDLILSTRGIFTSSAGYHEEVTKRYFMNSEGTYVEQEMLIIQAGFAATAREGTLTQTVRVAIGGNGDFTRIRNRHALIKDKARRAVELLKAEPATGGVCTVILDPDVAGVFTHEAFGHLSEADSIQFNQSMRDEMKLGRRLGRETLNIIDDGTIPGSPGSYPYDDEGVASRKVHLIREGVLAGRLHSRESAADFSEPVTGSMRASNFHHTPLVRQSNICIVPGTSTFEEMLASVKHGYYLVGMAGGQTIGDMFTFGTQYGFEISNGRLGRMVRDVNLSGNVFKTLMEISMIGNDLVMTEAGGCGKNGQMLTASGYGAPHIKLDNVTVGGR